VQHLEGGPGAVDRGGRRDRLHARGLRGRVAALDLIVDTAGRRPLSQLRRALTPKGTLVIVGGDGGGRWTGGFFRGMLRAPLVSLFVGQRMVGLATKIKHDDLVDLTALIEAGTLMPVIDRTYPLVEAPDAIRYLEKGHAAGKIVVTV